MYVLVAFNTAILAFVSNFDLNKKNTSIYVRLANGRRMKGKKREKKKQSEIENKKRRIKDGEEKRESIEDK